MCLHFICLSLCVCMFGNEVLHPLKRSVIVTNGLSSHSASSPLLPPGISCVAQSAIPSHPISSRLYSAPNTGVVKSHQVLREESKRDLLQNHLGWHWCSRTPNQIDTAATEMCIHQHSSASHSMRNQKTQLEIQRQHTLATIYCYLPYFIPVCNVKPTCFLRQGQGLHPAPWNKDGCVNWEAQPRWWEDYWELIL